MNQLLVMRHAKSAWDTAHADFDRPLNGRGTRDADRMARWLVSNDLVPDRVLSSSANRTRTTAMAVVHECAVDRRFVDFEDDLYLAPASAWLSALREQSHEMVLICGHNPGLDDLVETLASRRVRLTATGKLMTTAAVAHFELLGSWSELAPGTANLLTLQRPRELDS